MSVKVYEAVLYQHGKRVGAVHDVELFDELVRAVNTCCEEEVTVC